MDRRDFLRISVGSIVALPVISGILGGCESDVNKVTGQEIVIDLTPYPALQQIGGMVFVQKENYSFILRRDSQTHIIAFSAVCPHQGCLIGDQMGELHHHRIKCMCHGAEFDPANGGVVRGPATSGLTQYETVFDPQKNELRIII